MGNGVVVHLRGLLAELKTLREASIDYKGRTEMKDMKRLNVGYEEIEGRI